MLGFPPFTKLVKLEIRGRDRIKLEEKANQLAKVLRFRTTTTIYGPNQTFNKKGYLYNIILKIKDPMEDIAIIGEIARDWQIEVDCASTS